MNLSSERAVERSGDRRCLDSQLRLFDAAPKQRLLTFSSWAASRRKGCERLGEADGGRLRQDGDGRNRRAGTSPLHGPAPERRDGSRRSTFGRRVLIPCEKFLRLFDPEARRWFLPKLTARAIVSAGPGPARSSGKDRGAGGQVEPPLGGPRIRVGYPSRSGQLARRAQGTSGPKRPWSSTSTARSSSTYGTRWRYPSRCATLHPVTRQTPI